MFSSQKKKNSQLALGLSGEYVEDVKKALRRGADPNLTICRGQPPLFAAIKSTPESDALAITEALLEGGADVNKTNQDGETPLHYHMHRYSHYATVTKKLLDAGASLEARANNGQTPLGTALANKAWSAAHLLIDYERGRPALVADADALLLGAVKAGAPVELLQKIMAAPADVNTKAGGSPPALHLAIALGRKDILDYLLARPGVDVNIVDGEGKTPLLAAALLGHADLAASLLKAGAATDMADKQGRRPLVTAAQINNQELVEELLAAKSALDRADGAGLTPITAAAQNGSIRLVMTLLAAIQAAHLKVDLVPALFSAAGKGSTRVVELLAAAGADVNATGEDGRTPLMQAALENQIETLGVLIKAGAKPDICDRHGMQAYDHAVGGGKTQAKSYLERYRRDPAFAGSMGADSAEDGDGAVFTSPAPADDHRYRLLSPNSLEVSEGENLAMTFNFWTQQVIFRDPSKPSPPVVQNFADLQRQEAITEAYNRLRALGGTPPEPGAAALQKKIPALGRG